MPKPSNRSERGRLFGEAGTLGYDPGIEDASRDRWMRRTGPFYPLLVAFQLQSLLPVAHTLEPNDEDRSRARAWLPVVGFATGVALAAAAAVLNALLPPVAVAALVVGAAAVATGARFEVGAARVAGVLSGASGEERFAGGGALVPAPALALAVLLLIRFACVTGTAVAAWTGALISAHVVSRWAMLAVLEAPSLLRGRPASPAGEDEEEGRAPTPGWVPLAIATLLSAVVVGVAGRGAGLLAMLVAAVAALVSVYWLRARRLEGPFADATAAVAEVVALLCFVWMSPVG